MSLPKPGLPIPRNECNIPGRGTRQAWRKDILIVHPDKLIGANYDAVARAMAEYSYQVINAAHYAIQSEHDIPAKNGCMADANKLPITAQGLAKFTTNWVGKPDNDTQARASPNIRPHLIAW